MTARGVIFDLFGTLVPKWPSSTSRCAQERICTYWDVPKERFLVAWAEGASHREVGVTSVRESFAATARACGITDPDAVDQAHAMWCDVTRAALVLRPGVAATLERCRALGLRIGLASNCHDDVPEAFRNLHVAEALDELLFSCEVGVAKPDPRFYALVANRLGIRLEDAVYVGDGGSDELVGAVCAGMRAVWLRVDAEIQAEGLPSGAEGWRGPTITRVEQVVEQVESPR